MTKTNVLIFGTGPSADVAAQIFEEFTNHQVLGFTVDRAYIRGPIHEGKPVVAYEEVVKTYNRNDTKIFVSVGYAGLNKIRQQKCSQVIADGFELASLIHPKANLPSDFKHGYNCFIMNDVNIHPCVEIGDNNFIWSGSTLCHHVNVGSHCWFTSGSLVAGNTKVGSNCFFGAGAIATNSIEMGDHCFIGAGALVSKSIDDNVVIVREGDQKHRLNSEQFIKLLGNNF